jgi:hypothetical protein
MLERSPYKLVLQGNGEHDHLIISARFEFCHWFLYMPKYTEPDRFCAVDLTLFRQSQRPAFA